MSKSSPGLTKGKLKMNVRAMLEQLSSADARRSSKDLQAYAETFTIHQLAEIRQKVRG